MKRLLLAFALVAASCSAPQRRAAPPLAAAVAVADLHLGLRHYASDGARVLIVGAPGTSIELFDLPGYGGLATYLQRRGFDVWVVDWREAPRTATLEQLAASLRAVADHLTADGKPLKVFAHSLGGVVAIMASPRADAYVLVAVPATLKQPLDPVAAFAAAPPAGEHSLTELAPAYSGTQDRKLLDDLLWSYGVVPLGPQARARILAPVGPALLADLATAIGRGGWGERFDANLAATRVPTTVFVAQTDAVAPPWQTFETFKRVGAEKKTYRFFSRANGEKREYGHLSVLVGDDAVAETFPYFADALGD